MTIYCRSGNNGGSKIQRIWNLALMRGFKYSGNAISEKNNHTIKTTNMRNHPTCSKPLRYAPLVCCCLSLESSAIQMLHCLICIEKRLIDIDSWSPGRIISTGSPLVVSKTIAIILKYMYLHVGCVNMRAQVCVFTCKNAPGINGFLYVFKALPRFA